MQNCFPWRWRQRLRACVMKPILSLSLVTLAVLLITGCATEPQTDAQGGPAAECSVCRYNHDLACVNLKVKDSTPHTEYQGTTYYFCSEDCRAAFLKKPQKYVP